MPVVNEPWIDKLSGHDRPTARFKKRQLVIGVSVAVVVVLLAVGIPVVISDIGKGIGNGIGQGIGAALASPSSMVVTSDGRTLYVLRGSGLVDRVDLDAGTSSPVTPPAPTTSQDLLSQAADLGAAQVGSSAYGPFVIYADGHSLKIFSPISGQSVSVAAVSGTVYGLALSSDGTTAYVAEQGVARSSGGALRVVSLVEHRVLATIALPNQPNLIVVSRDGNVAYLLDRVAETIVSVNLATRTVGVPFNAVPSPFAMDLSADGKTLYVSSNNRSIVPVVTRTHRALPPIQLPGVDPYVTAVASSRATSAIYVGLWTNFGHIERSTLNIDLLSPPATRITTTARLSTSGYFG